MEVAEAASDLGRAVSEAVVQVGGDATVLALPLLQAADRWKVSPCHRPTARRSEVELTVLSRKAGQPFGRQTWCYHGH